VRGWGGAGALVYVLAFPISRVPDAAPSRCDSTSSSTSAREADFYRAQNWLCKEMEFYRRQNNENGKNSRIPYLIDIL